MSASRLLRDRPTLLPRASLAAGKGHQERVAEIDQEVVVTDALDGSAVEFLRFVVFAPTTSTPPRLRHHQPKNRPSVRATLTSTTRSGGQGAVDRLASSAQQPANTGRRRSRGIAPVRPPNITSQETSSAAAAADDDSKPLSPVESFNPPQSPAEARLLPEAQQR